MRLINRNKTDKNALSQVDLYRAYIDHAAAGFIIFDADLVLLEINQSAKQMIAGKAAATIGNGIQDVLPTMGEHDRFQALLEVIRTGKPLYFKDHFKKDDAQYRQFEITAFKMKSGLGMILLDVSVRKTNTVPLTGPDERAKAIQNVIHEPFLILDDNNHVLSANQSFYDHFRLKAQAVLSESIYDLGDRQWNIAELHELLDHKLSRTGSAKDFQIQGYFSSQAEQTLSLNATQFYCEQEEHIFTLLAIQDISEIANQREMLKKLTDIYLNAPDPILITDLQGMIIDLNDEVVKLYGWSRAELLHKSFKSIVPPDGREQFDTLFETVLLAQQFRDMETEHWSKIGERLPINLNIFVLQNNLGENIGTVAYIKHVAAQSQAEKAIKRRHTMLLSSNDPVIIMDRNGIITEINSAAELTYGWSKGGIAGKSGTTMFLPEDQKKFNTGFTDCLAGKTIRDRSVQQVTKQGIIRKAQISLFLLTDARNVSNGVVVIAKHSSDREQADRALNQLSRNFLEIDDPVIVENMAGKVTALNPAAASLYGWHKSDLMGKPAKSLIPIEQQKQADELMKKCQAGETVNRVESKRWTKSGKFIPVKLTMFQILNAEEVPSEIVSISRPVETSSAPAIKPGSLDFTGLFEASPMPIIIEDLAGKVMELNQTAEELLGWKQLDLKGKPLKMTIPADQHRQHDKLILLSQNDVPIQQVESKRWSRSGQVFKVSISLVLLRDGEGQPTAIANIFQDQTPV